MGTFNFNRIKKPSTAPYQRPSRKRQFRYRMPAPFVEGTRTVSYALAPSEVVGNLWVVFPPLKLAIWAIRVAVGRGIVVVRKGKKDKSRTNHARADYKTHLR